MLGASLFKAAWAYRHDRPWLDSQLEWLQRYRFDAIRAFGVVGHPSEPDYWDGREIDWRWDDYDQVIAGLTDLAFDKYGLRVQWTIFADAQKATTVEADRAALVERFIRMARGRERKILAFEVANEFWLNGFEGPDGVRELRAHAARLRAATNIPVAVSSHRDDLCPLYAEGVVDFATIHFDRTATQARWSPLTEPWTAARRTGEFASCPAMPAAASNNEPIGPGPSFLMPLHMVMSAVNTYLSGIPLYFFHSGPGIRDDPFAPDGLRPSRFDQLPQAASLFAGFAAIKQYVPEDVVSWRPLRPGEDFPFVVNGNAQVTLGAMRGNRFIVAFSGIAEPLELVARGALDVKHIDPMTGTIMRTHNLKPGQALRFHSIATVLDGVQQGR